MGNFPQELMPNPLGDVNIRLDSLIESFQNQASKGSQGSAMSYNVAKDSRAVSEGMRAWSDHGFAAGFAGIPLWATGSLPSTVFYNSFLGQLLVFEPSSEEAEARVSYCETMQNRLHAIEEKAFARRQRRAGWGVAVRTAAVCALMILVAILLASGRHGWAIAFFTSAFAIGAVLPKVITGRDQALSAAAFQDDRIPQTMPWMRAKTALEAQAV
jgi:hypothetical protein